MDNPNKITDNYSFESLRTIFENRCIDYYSSSNIKEKIREE